MAGSDQKYTQVISDLKEAHQAELQRLNAESKAEKESHIVALTKCAAEQSKRDGQQANYVNDLIRQHEQFVKDM
jgi:hypothetical protein